MRYSKLGLINLGIALLGQVIAWSWVASHDGDDTSLGAIAFAITWNLVPYGYALFISSLKRQFGVLNVISVPCLLYLAFIYWDGLLKPANSTAVIALFSWPLWHTIALMVISGFIFLVTVSRRSAAGRNEERPRQGEAGE